MVVGGRKRAVGVFSHRGDVEQALHELQRSGFDMDRVSVVVQDAENNQTIAGAEVKERVGDKADEGAKTGAVSGGALGGLTGLLVGLGTLAIPGIGPIMLAGATATTLATTLAGIGIGAAAGGLLGALIGLGIPEERAKVYNARVERGHYLVIIDGTDAEIARARAILSRFGIEEFDVYDQPNSSNVSADYVTPAAASVPGNYVASSTAAPRNVSHVSSPRTRTRRAIGVFSHRRDAEAALTELRNAGFPMNRISILAKDDSDLQQNLTAVNPDVNVGVGNKADEGAKTGAVTGGVLGGLTGLLVGLGTLAIPGVGPVILAGEAATALATALAGGAIGAAAGGLGGALVGLGIPEDEARVYSDRFNRGDYLLIVEGTDSQIHQAETILRRRGIEEFAIYDADDVDIDRTHSQSYDNTIPSSYSSQLDIDRDGEPEVIIVDRRDEKV